MVAEMLAAMLIARYGDLIRVAKSGGMARREFLQAATAAGLSVALARDVVDASESIPIGKLSTTKLPHGVGGNTLLRLTVTNVSSAPQRFAANVFGYAEGYDGDYIVGFLDPEVPPDVTSAITVAPQLDFSPRRIVMPDGVEERFRFDGFSLRCGDELREVFA